MEIESDLQNKSSPEADKILQGVKGLWTMKDLADWLNLPVQSLYDYRYRQQLDNSVFIMLGRKLRVLPHKAVNLALKGELIKLD